MDDLTKQAEALRKEGKKLREIADQLDLTIVRVYRLLHPESLKSEAHRSYAREYMKKYRQQVKNKDKEIELKRKYRQTKKGREVTRKATAKYRSKKKKAL